MTSKIDPLEALKNTGKPKMGYCQRCGKKETAIQVVVSARKSRGRGDGRNEHLFSLGGSFCIDCGPKIAHDLQDGLQAAKDGVGVR